MPRTHETPDPIDGRAQPGDVLGIENDGETTHLGETADDEDDRLRDAKEEEKKSRD